MFDAIDEILKRVDKHIDEQLLFASLTRVAAGSLLNDCLQLVDLSFIEREERPIVGRLDSRWLPEDEPPRVVIDSWARGVLPVKVRTAAEAAAQQQAAAEQHARATTTASRFSVPASERARRESGTSDATQGVDGRPSSGEREVVSSRRQLMMSSSRKERQNTKKLTVEEMELEQRLREEIQARRVAQEYRKRQASRRPIAAQPLWAPRGLRPARRSSASVLSSFCPARATHGSVPVLSPTS